jgi:hypothetical protein
MKASIYILVFLLSFLDINNLKADDKNSANNYYVNIDLFKKYLFTLGNDIFEGRAPGTTGGNLSAKYLADKFDNLRLKPIGNNNTYYQNIQMHGCLPTEQSKLTVYADSLEFELEFGKDYLLYKTGEQTYSPRPLELVFVGYGINAPEYDYNDYHSVDVEGKIAVYLSGEPISNNPKYFEGNKKSIYSYPDIKHNIALAHGAAGTILIPDPYEFLTDEWNSYINSFGFEDVTLAYSATSSLSLLINPISSELLFNNCQFSLQSIFDMEKNNKLMSFPLNTKISFIGNFIQRDFIAQNVIGMLDGSDPILKDSYIVISAHYDHLGIGPAIGGDSIYNGVLDNAAGVSAVLEIARVLSQNKISPKRSIIFLLTTGEEKGLLGSTFYADNPIVPLYKTVACINIDGISFIDRVKSIVPIGAEYSSLSEIINKVAKENRLSISTIPREFMQEESFLMSDQAAFAKAGIPSVLIMDGTDYENISSDSGIAVLKNYSMHIYHTPFDDLNQKINYDAVKQSIQFFIQLIINIANSEVEPEWHSGTPYLNARLRAKAEKR